MTVKISLKNVSKSFGSKNVLNNVNLDVEKGKSLVILGGSGSGKSVMLKLILGIIKTDSGQIIVDGDDALKYNAKQRNQFLEKFGMLFQGGALFDSLPVWQNICFALIQSNKLTKKDAVDYAVELLRKVGLGADVALLSPAELSGGMQKRVSLARAIARKPDIIFFDEPTTGLDPIMADVINNLIISTSKDLGATTISITHDMHSARKISDKIAMLYKGNIVWQGTANELDPCANPYVDQFVHGRAEGPIAI